MDETKDARQSNSQIELIAEKLAKNKANVAKWGLSSVYFLFALLIITIIR